MGSNQYKVIVVLFFFLSGSFLFAQGGLKSNNPQAWDYELLVQLNPEVNPTHFIQNWTSTKHSIQAEIQLISGRWNIFSWKGNSKDIFDRLKNDPEVLHVQEDALIQYRDREVPNDPQFDQQWNMEIIEAPEVWSMTQGGQTLDNREIVVAIIDSGCDINHPDLQSNIWRNEAEIPDDGIDNDQNGFIDDYFGWNFQTLSDEHPLDVHGSAITGIIGAKGNNSTGVSGVNWNIKVLQLSNANSVGETISAYSYIADLRERYNNSNGMEGAYIVVSNASFGIDNAFEDDFPVWCGLYDDLGQLGILNTVAVTNLRRNVDATGDIPSRCPSEYVLSVTNTNQLDEKVRNAGWGAISVDIGAPGDGSLTTKPNNEYETFGGTSTAVAHVSGAAALLWSMDIPGFQEKLDGDQAELVLYIKRLILNSVDPIPSLDGLTLTGGRLNVYKAVQLMIQETNENPEFELLNVFPIPASDRIELLISNPEGLERINFRIIDFMGRQVDVGTFEFSKIPFGQFFLNVGNYSNGAYVIRFEDGNNSVTKKFIVLK